MAGCSTAVELGKVLRNTLPISTGENSVPVTGVFLCDRGAKCGSVPVCVSFLSAFFTVFTILFARPFDCGYHGLEWTSFIPHEAANCLMSQLAKGTLFRNSMPSKDHFHLAYDRMGSLVREMEHVWVY